jgi:hypothetical protein
MNILEKRLTPLFPWAGGRCGAGRHGLPQPLVLLIGDTADRIRYELTATHRTPIMGQVACGIDSRTSPEQLQPRCQQCNGSHDNFVVPRPMRH